MDAKSKDTSEKPWSYVVAIASFIAQVPYYFVIILRGEILFLFT